MAQRLTTRDQVDNLLNDCGTGDGYRSHRKLTAATREAARKYITGLTEEAERLCPGQAVYSRDEMEIMVHAFNDGYLAALKK